MADARISVFQNFPVVANNPAYGRFLGAGSLHIHGVFIPGSISFNNLVMAVSVGTGNKTVTISFGLYSLNGASLSIANSASRTYSAAGAAGVHLSFATSAAQDITPGNWYFAVLYATGGNSLFSFLRGNQNDDFVFAGTNPIVGAIVRGQQSVSTAGLPAAIATTDIAQEGSNTDNISHAHPYIVITA